MLKKTSQTPVSRHSVFSFLQTLRIDKADAGKWGFAYALLPLSQATKPATVVTEVATANAIHNTLVAR